MGKATQEATDVIWCGIQSDVIHVPVDTSFLYYEYGAGSCLVRSTFT